jgi:hypothetical protein
MSVVQDARLRSLKVSKWTARVLVAGAFALSSVALDKLAMAAHIPGWLAWIWPVCVDGMIFQASTSVMALAGRKDSEARRARRWFAWMIGGGVATSVAANGLHAWTMLGHALTWWQVTAVAIVPPILLLVATHGVTILAGLDDVASLGEDQDRPEQEAVAEPVLPRITVERADEPVEAIESAPQQAISAEPEPQPLVVAEQQVALEPATAGHLSRPAGASQRNPERVIQAQQLHAAGEPVDVIAERLEVSTRTVRRYLRVEVTETTVTPLPAAERPQLFAVGDHELEREVVGR